MEAELQSRGAAHPGLQETLTWGRNNNKRNSQNKQTPPSPLPLPLKNKKSLNKINHKKKTGPSEEGGGFFINSGLILNPCRSSGTWADSDVAARRKLFLCSVACLAAKQRARVLFYGSCVMVHVFLLFLLNSRT